MGKIHDALQRAEEERAKAGAPPAGVTATQRALDLALEPARPPLEERARQRSDARRSRVMISEADPTISEEYRTLRARIQSLRRTHPFKTLVVTSALPAEGKTTTAFNLALSFGLETETRTCLVDADMRTPAIHHSLPETPAVGLAELLEGDAKLERALVQIPDTRLSVLSVQAIPNRPAELLASERAMELMEELRCRFDTVIIDSPPVLGLADTTTLVDLCDAALIVVSRGGASSADVQAVLERIDASKAIGCVFNLSTEIPKPYGDYSQKRG